VQMILLLLIKKIKNQFLIYSISNISKTI
jgi:hypothetical protein